MIGTRPDIGMAVGVLSRFSNKYTDKHWKVLKKLICYLSGTADYRLTLGGLGKVEVEVFADADWGADALDRKSVTGVVARVGGKGPYMWKSKKQSTVALSTTEAEYMALTKGCQEALWMRRLLRDIGHKQKTPTIIYEDNQGCIELAKNPKHHERTKHMDIKYHFVREKVENKEVKLVYIETNKQLADCLTKPLGKNLLRKCLVGLCIGNGDCTLSGSIGSVAIGNIHYDQGTPKKGDASYMSGSTRDVTDENGTRGVRLNKLTNGVA
jgi:hypothetical protein